MPSFTQWTAALALTSTALSTPVQLDKRGAFSVHQVERTTYLKNGPEQKVKTLRKYGKPVPQSLLAAAENRANAAEVFSVEAVDGSAPAVPGDEYDSLYLSPVTIGSKTLQLDFDTGSSDL